MGTFNGKNFLEEDAHNGDRHRKEYLQSVLNLIDKKYAESYEERASFMPAESFPEKQEFYRDEYLKMIGSPVKEYPKDIPCAKKEKIGEDDFGIAYRMQIEVLPDFWFYGILTVPHGIDKAPLVIAQHGGWGIPELCCDMAGENNYDYFTKRALEEGMVVFAPQLLLWCFDTETGEKRVAVDVSFDRNDIDRKLKHLGFSITGLEVFCIRRSIDYLASLDFVDEDKIGMMGLSYGGYFSIYTAAADTRIKSVYSAAAFNDRTKIAFHNWMYKDAANTFLDGEVAGLCAPIRLQIDVGKEDHVFDYSLTPSESERAKKYYKAFNAEDNFRFNLWEGGHKFDVDGEGFNFFFDGLK